MPFFIQRNTNLARPCSCGLSADTLPAELLTNGIQKNKDCYNKLLGPHGSWTYRQMGGPSS